MFNATLQGLATPPAQVGPSPVVPTVPDYGICDRRYGANLTPLLCNWAADTLEQGDSVVPYTVVPGGTPGPRTLPYTAIFGGYLLSSKPFLPYLTAVGQATATFGLR